MPQTVDVIADSLQLPAAAGRQFFIADTSAASLTLTLPPFATTNGPMTIVKGATENTLTIACGTGNTWNGVTTSITLSDRGDAVRAMPGTSEYKVTINKTSIR